MIDQALWTAHCLENWEPLATTEVLASSQQCHSSKHYKYKQQSCILSVFKSLTTTYIDLIASNLTSQTHLSGFEFPTSGQTTPCMLSSNIANLLESYRPVGQSG